MRIYALDNTACEYSAEEVDFSAGSSYWFDLSPKELSSLNDSIFGFSRDSLDECENITQFAKVDFYDDYTFLVLNSLKYENGTVCPDEFNVFIGKQYIVTVSKKDVRILTELREAFLDNENTILAKNQSPSRVTYYILDKLIQGDYEVISKLENTADTLEIHILKKPSKQFLTALLHMRHQVHTLRKCITPLRYIGDNLIENENGIIDSRCTKNLAVINSKIEKLMFSLDSLIQYIALVREAFETEMANKENEFMKLFAALSLFFVPVSVVIQLFQMFIYIPQVKLRYGYMGIIGIFVVCLFIIYMFFKKKEWL